MVERPEQEYEAKRLDRTVSEANTQLEHALQLIEAKQGELEAYRQELANEPIRPSGNLYMADNFADLAAFSQYMNPLALGTAETDMEANRVDSLKRLIDSPYFARIDFRYDGETDAEQVYIGRSSLIAGDTGETLVVDWRAPISSVFYRFGTGKASFEAPRSEITGEVLLKRQFEIRSGKLEYFFDSDVQIVDDFLRKMLSENTSGRMKTIVETLQRDQDIVVRDHEHGLLMVQGVAGSGKTSIGLHRVAYLMYQGLQTRLQSHNIIVISPNRLFEQYIEGVLPELGESRVVSVLFEDIFQRVLGVKRVESRNEFIETLIASEDQREQDVMRECLAFKGSRMFMEILERLIEELPGKWIEFRDVYYDDQCVMRGEAMRAKVLNDGNGEPLSTRLKRLEQSIWDVVHERKPQRIAKLTESVKEQSEHMFEIDEYARMLSIAESTALAKGIRTFTELDIAGIYARLFSDKAVFERLSIGLELPGNIDSVISRTVGNTGRDELAYEDALALSFLHLKVYGSRAFSDIKQVVTDEAQDYYPMHFALLKLLFPTSRYTVLGDINQAMEKQEGLGFYDAISEVLQKDKPALVAMDKSFRCTSEILEFSKRFLSEKTLIKNFNRSGDAPGIYAASDEPALDDMLISEIETCKTNGYGSIALICKTRSDARALFERLKDRLDIKLTGDGDIDDVAGTCILPIFLSKGLEFDAVLICGADAKRYRTPHDRNLLYICCTRALHRLNLFHTGRPSPLLTASAL